MIDLDQYHTAIEYTASAHGSQKIKDSNQSYLKHLSMVTIEVINAFQINPNFNLNKAITISLLHDVIEDTDENCESIELSFGKEIADSVQALTKNIQLSGRKQLLDSINRIKNESKEVAIVKIADRISNLNIPPKSWGKKKIKSYHNDSIILLEKLKGVNYILENRLSNKIKNYKNYYEIIN